MQYRGLCHLLHLTYLFLNNFYKSFFLLQKKDRDLKLKNNYSKSKKIIRFLKAKLTTTNDGKIELEVLKGQESFRIKSFVESNVWGLFKYGQSDFKKGELIDCYPPIGSNINIFK